jgi:hypothetical protein
MSIGFSLDILLFFHAFMSRRSFSLLGHHPEGLACFIDQLIFEPAFCGGIGSFVRSILRVRRGMNRSILVSIME